MQFTVVAIPLNRPAIVDFLAERDGEPRGASISTLAQRPTAEAEHLWVRRLSAPVHAEVADLLVIDDPHTHLFQTWTDRLIPEEFLRETGFLTRNLGGWTPIYFGVVEVAGTAADQWQEDPLLKHAQQLQVYGSQIKTVGADPAQVADLLEEETGNHVDDVARALGRLHALRSRYEVWPPGTHSARVAYVDAIYAEIAEEGYFSTAAAPPISRILLLDELLGQMVILETQRRRALARGAPQEADAVSAAQRRWQEESGLVLILKGEYIVGRHRRSTVLLAPELAVVVKQPAPEPLHEIGLGAGSFEGREENWPQLVDGGPLVTPRGRIRLTLEEGLVPALNQVFERDVRFSTLLGFGVEPFVPGQTVQQAVLADPERLTPGLYEEIVLHQQVCEALGAENGDWHSANFILREADGAPVHVDWGAARPLRDGEKNDREREGRLNQVQNIAYSFHDEGLAARTTKLHRALLADEERLDRLRERAQARIAEAGVTLPSAQ